jgi:hypothetical protein
MIYIGAIDITDKTDTTGKLPDLLQENSGSSVSSKLTKLTLLASSPVCGWKNK